MGVGIAIDDFGTGYSSLAYLKDLPIDEVKIDQSFIQDMANDAANACIVRAVVDLGHNLGLRVTAEAVEDARTLDLLAETRLRLRPGLPHQPSPPPRRLRSLARTPGPQPRLIVGNRVHSCIISLVPSPLRGRVRVGGSVHGRRLAKPADSSVAGRATSPHPEPLHKGGREGDRNESNPMDSGSFDESSSFPRSSPPGSPGHVREIPL